MLQKKSPSHNHVRIPFSAAEVSIVTTYSWQSSHSPRVHSRLSRERCLSTFKLNLLSWSTRIHSRSGCCSHFRVFEDFFLALFCVGNLTRNPAWYLLIIQGFASRNWGTVERSTTRIIARLFLYARRPDVSKAFFRRTLTSIGNLKYILSDFEGKLVD